MQGVIALLLTPLKNVGKMLTDDRLADGAHILPHMLGAVLLHLGADGRADDIAGLQLIRKAVSVFVQQQRALAAHRLRDEEPAALFAAEQRCGVDLDIVKMAAATPWRSAMAMASPVMWG